MWKYSNPDKNEDDENCWKLQPPSAIEGVVEQIDVSFTKLTNYPCSLSTLKTSDNTLYVTSKVLKVQSQYVRKVPIIGNLLTYWDCRLVSYHGYHQSPSDQTSNPNVRSESA